MGGLTKGQPAMSNVRLAVGKVWKENKLQINKGTLLEQTKPFKRRRH